MNKNKQTDLFIGYLFTQNGLFVMHFITQCFETSERERERLISQFSGNIPDIP